MLNPNFDDLNFEEMNDLVSQFEDMMKKDRTPSFMDETSFEKILDYYEERDEVEKAIEVADIATTQFPFSSSFLVRKAQLLFDSKELDPALELLDKAEILDAMDANIYLLRADIYVWQGNYQQGIDSINEAIDKCDKQEYADLYLELADIYEEWEKYDLVFATLRKVLRLNPDNEEALNRIWFCVEFTEQYEDSIKFHKAYVERNPYSYLAWFNLAHAYAGMKRNDEAVEAFEFVMAINETYDYAYKDCAELLVKLGKYQKAADHFKSALEYSNKPYKELYYSIGQCYEKMENYNKARYYFRKATNIDPFFEEAFYKIGYNYQLENKWENAISSYERAYKLSDKNCDYVTALAKVYRETGDLDQSVMMYEKAIELDEKCKDLWLDLAKTLFEAGCLRDALEVLETATGKFENRADIMYTRSAMYYQIGNRNSAFVSLESGLLEDPTIYHLAFDITPYMENDPSVCTILDQYLN